MQPERLAQIDLELASFALSDERIAETIARAKKVRETASDLDAELSTLGAPTPRSTTTAEPGARATTWDEARELRKREPSEEGSGLLDVSEDALRSGEIPAVLALDAAPEDAAPEYGASGAGASEVDASEVDASEIEEPISASTAYYIDPPTHPPPQPVSPSPASPVEEAFALDLDPEAGLVEPGAAPLSYVPAARPVTQTPPRPSSAPSASTDDLLAEMLDGPDPLEPPAIEAEVVEPELPASVAEDETSAALAAIGSGELGGSDFGALDRQSLAEIDRDADSAFEASFDEDEEPERTVMMKADALLPPAGDDVSADIELDIDEDVLVIDEEPAQASAKSRPPPPPPKPSDIPRSRPPAPPGSPPSNSPPGKGFLSRLLKSNKP